MPDFQIITIDCLKYLVCTFNLRVMRALVVYESFFGNTQDIAKAIAAGLQMKYEVVIKSVDDCNPKELRTCDLLVIGSATRGFRPSPGTQAFLRSIEPRDVSGLAIAAFDTRIDLESIKSRVFRWIVKTGGYAAERISRVLDQKGAILATKPKGFLVLGKEGPLKEGELERAGEWGNLL